MVTHDFCCDKCGEWMVDLPVDSVDSFPCLCGGRMVWTPTRMNLSRVSERPNEIDFENYHTYEQRLKAAKLYFKRREERGTLPPEFKNIPIEVFVPKGDGTDVQAHLEQHHKETTSAIAKIDEQIREVDREMKSLSPERQSEVTQAFMQNNIKRGRGVNLAAENIKVVND